MLRPIFFSSEWLHGCGNAAAMGKVLIHNIRILHLEMHVSKPQQ